LTVKYHYTINVNGMQPLLVAATMQPPLTNTS
jgi:hypothetical protein